MGAFIMFWAIGQGIIIYRAVAKNHRPPVPGELIGSAGIFALLALIAESPSARPAAVALAAGFDIAAFMNLFPPVTGPHPAQQETSQGVPPPAHGWRKPAPPKSAAAA